MTETSSENQPYTKHFDTLVALVTHLSNTQYISRTPKGAADALGLERSEVQEVLDRFSGFFENPETSTRPVIITTPFICGTHAVRLAAIEK